MDFTPSGFCELPARIYGPLLQSGYRAGAKGSRGEIQPTPDWRSVQGYFRDGRNARKANPGYTHPRACWLLAAALAIGWRGSMRRCAARCPISARTVGGGQRLPSAGIRVGIGLNSCVLAQSRSLCACTPSLDHGAPCISPWLLLGVDMACCTGTSSLHIHMRGTDPLHCHQRPEPTDAFSRRPSSTSPSSSPSLSSSPSCTSGLRAPSSLTARRSVSIRVPHDPRLVWEVTQES